MELLLITKSDMQSDDKYYQEQYKVYMNLIWFNGVVGLGGGDVAGGADYRPTDASTQILDGIEKDLAAARAAVPEGDRQEPVSAYRASRHTADHGREPAGCFGSGSSASNFIHSGSRFSAAPAFSIECTSRGVQPSEVKKAGPSGGANRNGAARSTISPVRLCIIVSRPGEQMSIAQLRNERLRGKVASKRLDFGARQINQQTFRDDERVRRPAAEPSKSVRLAGTSARSSATRSS